MAKHFTKEQLEEIGRHFDISPKTDTAVIRDGVIKKGDTVWWRCSAGPQRVNSEKDWDNILAYPEFYQITEPRFTINYFE